MTDFHATSQPDPRAVRRGRIIALLLFAIAVLPVVLATAMYFGGWGATGASANKGQLLQPVAHIDEFDLADEQGQPLNARFYPLTEEPKWLVLTLAERCQDACREAIHTTRQVHIALGRESDRVERALWSPSLPEDQLTDYPELIRLSVAEGQSLPAELPGAGDLQQSYQIYVVDPNGNVILRYDNGNSGEDLLDDLKKLLRLSNIG